MKNHAQETNKRKKRKTESSRHRRQDRHQKKEQFQLEKSKKKDKADELPASPYEHDWDIDGRMLTFADAGAGDVLSRVGPPKVFIDYEGAREFRLYTYSLRYNELIEWHFKIFNSGELWVKKIAEVRDSE